MKYCFFVPKSKNVKNTFLESMSISKNRDVMCKQTVTFSSVS